MTEDKLKALDAMKLKLHKKFGKESINTLRDKPVIDIDSISSGDIGLDIALGVGGFPKGRIIEVYGPESCIDKDTYIRYCIFKKGKMINKKGGTIERLYQRFHNKLDIGKKQGMHLQNNNNVDFYVNAVNEDNIIIRNKIIDVVDTGKKKVFRLITQQGNTIECTEDHKFLTPQGYKSLKNITVSDTVYVHNNTRVKGRKYLPTRPEKLVKYHPFAKTKVINNNLYYRVKLSKCIYEAHLNGLTLEEWINILNTKNKEEIKDYLFLDTSLHIHHKDENFLNNNIDNLMPIDPKDHGRLHSKKRIKNLSFIADLDLVVDITEVGIKQTYDIKCLFPYNNYIANNFVVHNSGKTTLALHAIAEAQKEGGIAAFIDAEHAFDPKYAKGIGINTDELWLSQPSSGEEGLEMCQSLVESGAVDIVVIDSVAALTPRAEIDGDIGDSHIGLLARLMSQAMRKLTSIISQKQCVVIFINQIREKIGCVSPETMITWE